MTASVQRKPIQTLSVKLICSVIAESIDTHDCEAVTNNDNNNKKQLVSLTACIALLQRKEGLCYSRDRHDPIDTEAYFSSLLKKKPQWQD